MYALKDIKMIHLEITESCQASCSMCNRTTKDGKLNPHLSLSELTLEDCKNIFPPQFLKQLHTIYMCGNHGDPLIARETLEVFRYFRSHNPNLSLTMVTNGGARDQYWWKELAYIINGKGMVVFSIDGLKDTNHIYREGVNWDIVERSVKSFISAKGKARWDYLVFEHNQHQVEEARKLSEEWGFEKFSVKKSSRFVSLSKPMLIVKSEEQSVNRKGVEITIVKPNENYQNSEFNKADTVLKKYGDLDNYHDNSIINCKVKNEGSLYISAEGLALPCCWTAYLMYKKEHSNHRKEQIWDFIDAVGGKEALNAKKGLDKVFSTGIFDNIKNSWSKPSCNDGKLKVCSTKCGTEIDLYKGQFQ